MVRAESLVVSGLRDESCFIAWQERVTATIPTGQFERIQIDQPKAIRNHRVPKSGHDRLNDLSSTDRIGSILTVEELGVW